MMRRCEMSALARWVEYVDERRDMRALIKRVFGRLVNGEIAKGFQTWLARARRGAERGGCRFELTGLLRMCARSKAAAGPRGAQGRQSTPAAAPGDRAVAVCAAHESRVGLESVARGCRPRTTRARAAAAHLVAPNAVDPRARVAAVERGGARARRGARIELCGASARAAGGGACLQAFSRWRARAGRARGQARRIRQLARTTSERRRGGRELS